MSVWSIKAMMDMEITKAVSIGRDGFLDGAGELGMMLGFPVWAMG